MSRNQHPFKQRDVVRAMRSAEAAGLTIGGVEVVTKDGTIIRVLGKDAAGHGNDLDNWIAKREGDARPA
jgi:hypothetical protein